MSGYPNQQPMHQQIYPQFYNSANAPPPQNYPGYPAGQPAPGQPAPVQPAPGQPGYPAGQYPYQPGFAVGQAGYPGQPGQPGQPGYAGQPGQPAYAGQPGQPGYAGQPGQPGYAGHGNPTAMSYPGIAPTAVAPSAPAYGYPGFPTVTPNPSYGPAVEWVSTTPANALQSLSDRAVVGGYEGYDGSPLWVIRAHFEGDLIPGKLAAKHHAAYVAWGGAENAVQNIEVCCARPERVRWVESRDGVIPPNAIAAGKTCFDEPLYVGRAKEQGSLTPGKVHPSHKVLYISFAGKELPYKTYEVLCQV